MNEIAPGLWRWTAPHPEWRPAKPGSAEDWEQVVGSVMYEGPGAVVFFDPLLPTDARGFWRWADERVAGRPVAVLTTIGWHRRRRDELVARYGATTSRAKRNLPAGVESIPLRGAGETLFWIAEHGAVIAGDRLLGDGHGRLRLCPPSWLTGTRVRTEAELRPLLAPLLELPVQRVLVSHGEPVLEGGGAALRELLAA